ncbi:sugar ABC transporter substrate-binding protein, partial [Enterococcus faecalis]|nr:sugar ABC transporter substrate-binding protein [Enterococcus faecalis]
TKAPNASLAFVDFATRYQMVMKRYKTLGIVPTQKDVVDKIGGVSKVLYTNLEKGNIVIMPSISAVSQIWTPTQTYFADITKDAFRPENEKKYKTLADLKSGLKNVEKQISDAIHT